MGDFDSIKIGVCDAFYTPVPTTAVPNPTEVFLGLTKGGVEVTYTPTFKDIQVDQYGQTPVDSVLIGESILAKIPLAETDKEKLAMFSPTASKMMSGNAVSKLTFGRNPGLRLGTTAGKLRLHPVANGNDISEDLTVYRAANKGAMQLNYKMDDEKIFNCEFNGMIVRNNPNGAYLFEIGDSSAIVQPLASDLANLESYYAMSSEPAPMVTPSLNGSGVSVVAPGATQQLQVSVIVNGILRRIDNAVVPITKPTYSVISSVVGTNALSGPAVTVDADGLVTVLDNAALKLLTYSGATSPVVGTKIVSTIKVTYGGKETLYPIEITVA